MTAEELGRTLTGMYHSAKKREAMTMIHLFGVKYANEIRDCGMSVTEVVRLSGLRENLSREVYKGIKLADYVIPRNER